MLKKEYPNWSIFAQNLEEKQLTYKIVYPGNSHYGFIYFGIKKKDDMTGIKDISFDVKNIRTNEIVTILTVRK